MNAVELVLLVEELKPLHVPGDVPCVRHDLEVRHLGDQPLLLLVEVPRVGERQTGARLLEHVHGELRWGFAFGMEMSRQRNGRCLSLRWTIIQKNLTRYGERRSDCGWTG